MNELSQRLSKLKADIESASEKLDLKQKTERLKELEVDMAKPDFWQDSNQAQQVSKQHAKLQQQTQPWVDALKSVGELIELAGTEDDSLAKELETQVQSLESKIQSLKKELRFSGPYDDHDIILAVYAGAGGTDAQDWAQMLLRMYQRFAEAEGLKTQAIESSSGEEAGIKSAVVEITGGSNLYGKLAGEHGVHRLVRLSPFNADHKRQTSFAKVDILPKIDQPDELQLDDKDLKIDVFRSGGAGGQSVNTTDSAVRVTHLPTGITVAIQNERSQLQNKETALSILRSRLAALQLEQHAASLSDIKGPNQSAEWGNQIRSYVLHPYKQVKDNRTGFESSDPQAILDGSLQPLIDSWLDRT